MTISRSQSVRPKLDGDLSDPIWERAAVVTADGALSGQTPNATTAFFAHDDQFLFIALQCDKSKSVIYPDRAGERVRDIEHPESDRIGPSWISIAIMRPVTNSKSIITAARSTPVSAMPVGIQLGTSRVRKMRAVAHRGGHPLARINRSGTHPRRGLVRLVAAPVAPRLERNSILALASRWLVSRAERRGPVIRRNRAN